jgi:hypothetical protein
MADSFIKSLDNIESQAKSMSHLNLLIWWFAHYVFIIDNQHSNKNYQHHNYYETDTDRADSYLRLTFIQIVMHVVPQKYWLWLID